MFGLAVAQAAEQVLCWLGGRWFDPQSAVYESVHWITFKFWTSSTVKQESDVCQTLTETCCWQEDQTTVIPHTTPSLSCHRLETTPVTPVLHWTFTVTWSKQTFCWHFISFHLHAASNQNISFTDFPHSLTASTFHAGNNKGNFNSCFWFGRVLKEPHVSYFWITQNYFVWSNFWIWCLLKLKMLICCV